MYGYTQQPELTTNSANKMSLSPSEKFALGLTEDYGLEREAVERQLNNTKKKNTGLHHLYLTNRDRELK